MSAQAKRVALGALAVFLAGVFVCLGLWQMRSYEESTRDVSAERAAEQAVPLIDQVAADGASTDIYGKPVTVTGTYDPTHQVLVGTEHPLRVATALELPDGRYVAVVRGTTDDESVSEAPTGEQSFEAIFLASDKAAEDPAAADADLATLRIQTLAQEWPSPLLGGYVTLSAEDSAAQGLGAAELELPEAEGSATHRGYALQWWVFAAGALAFGFYGVRGIKDDDDTPPSSVDNPVLTAH